MKENSIKNTSEKGMIYRIDHYYSVDHDKYCLLIESSIEVGKLIKILASIQLKFEELIDVSICVDDRHLLEILKKFYHVKDVKDKYAKFLSYTHPKNGEWDLVNNFSCNDTRILQIDLYEARESYCGPKYKEIMAEVLPSDKEFEDMVKGYREFYK